jgi:hypothetical protein
MPRNLLTHEVRIAPRLKPYPTSIDYSKTPTTAEAVARLKTGTPILDDVPVVRRRADVRKDLSDISPAVAARLRASEARRLCVSLSAEVAALRQRLAALQT